MKCQEVLDPLGLHGYCPRSWEFMMLGILDKRGISWLPGHYPCPGCRKQGKMNEGERAGGQGGTWWLHQSLRYTLLRITSYLCAKEGLPLWSCVHLYRTSAKMLRLLLWERERACVCLFCRHFLLWKPRGRLALHTNCPSGLLTVEWKWEIPLSSASCTIRVGQ